MTQKKCRQIGLLVILAFLFLGLCSSLVYAENITAPTKLWIEPSESGGIPAQIDWFKKNTGSTYNPSYIYQFFLPGNAVLEECFLSWDSDAQVSVDGTVYDSGTCPIPSINTDKIFVFKDGDQTLASFKIIVYQGSENVVPVFIDIDESEGHHTIAEMDGDSDHEIECTGRINIAGEWYSMPKIKGRGNATWKEARDKKPYNVNLDTKITFPGIDSDATKKWSFLAENLDRSLLGNRIGYHAAYLMDIGQDTASADVWMNGEYQGCYTVTPKTDSFVTKDGFMIEQDNYQEKPVSEGGDPQFSLEGSLSKRWVIIC